MNAAKTVSEKGTIQSPLLDNRDICFDNTFPIAINENSFANILNLFSPNAVFVPKLLRSPDSIRHNQTENSPLIQLYDGDVV